MDNEQKGQVRQAIRKVFELTLAELRERNRKYFPAWTPPKGTTANRLRENLIVHDLETIINGG